MKVSSIKLIKNREKKNNKLQYQKRTENIYLIDDFVL